MWLLQESSLDLCTRQWATQKAKAEDTSPLKAWAWESKNVNSATFYWSKQVTGLAWFKGREITPLLDGGSDIRIQGRRWLATNFGSLPP